MLFMLYSIGFCARLWGFLFAMFTVGFFKPHLTPKHRKWIGIYFTLSVGIQFVCLRADFHVSHFPSFLCSPPTGSCTWTFLHYNQHQPQQVLFLLPNTVNACTEEVVCIFCRDTVTIKIIVPLIFKWNHALNCIFFRLIFKEKLIVCKHQYQRHQPASAVILIKNNNVIHNTVKIY